MAVSYALDGYNEISNCNTTSSGGTWSGGNAVAASSDDPYVYGTAAIGYTVRQASTFQLNFEATTAMDFSTDTIVRMWFNSSQLFADKASNGIRLYITDGSNTAYWNVLGGDTYPGGWYLIAVDLSTTPDSGTKPTNMANVTDVGLDVTTLRTTKNAPSTFIDHLHQCNGAAFYGDAGTSIPFDFGDAYDLDNTLSTKWGLIKPVDTIWFSNSYIVIGDASGSNNTLFEVEDQVFVWDASIMGDGVIGFDVVQGTGATNAVINRCVFKASSDDFDLDLSDTLSNLDVYGTSFINARTYNLGASADIQGCVFVSCGTGIVACAILNTTFSLCGAITGTSGSFTNCTFDSLTAPIVHDDLDGFDSCNFISDGTGHAINLGTISSNDAMGWNCTASGYASSDGSTGNETILVSVASGITLTVNVASGATTPTFYNTGSGDVSVVVAPVTVKVTVTDASGTLIDNARVILKAANGTGPFPYQDVVTISNSGTTATVTHSGHNLLSNDKVEIRGASHDENNGVFQVTYISSTQYSYTMSSDPGSSPTGTITATFVALSGLTSSGVLQTSRAYSSDQPVIGWARRSTSSPYYKTGPLSGTVDSANGYNNTAVLILDE